MRLIGTAAAFYIGAIASAQDPTTSATSHGKRKTHVEVSAIRAADAASAKAIRRHRHDFREDAPGAGRQCTPSSLWAKEVDPTEYEIGCKEIEVRDLTVEAHRFGEVELRDNGLPPPAVFSNERSALNNGLWVRVKVSRVACLAGVLPMLLVSSQQFSLCTFVETKR